MNEPDRDRDASRYEFNEEDINELTGVSDEDLELLKSEADILGDGDEVATAERLLKENLPIATLQIVKLATSASSDRVRFDASKYIVERNMGRLQDITPQSEDPLTAFGKMLQDEEDTTVDA